MIQTLLKTTALVVLVACVGAASAKDDDKGNKGGKGKPNAAQGTYGPAPAGDAVQVATQAAAGWVADLSTGQVLFARRDGFDGSITFVWEAGGGTSGGRTAVRAYRIFTFNGVLNREPGDCRKAASADWMCNGLGL